METKIFNYKVDDISACFYWFFVKLNFHEIFDKNRLTRGLQAAHKSVQMALARDFRSVPKI